MSKTFLQTIGLMATANVILLVNGSIQIEWVWKTINLLIFVCGIYAIGSTINALKEKQFLDYFDFFVLGVGSILLGATNLIQGMQYANEINLVGFILIVVIACFELAVFYSNFKVKKPEPKINSLIAVQPKFRHSIYARDTLA